MNMDLFKYIMKLSVIPMMFVSLLLITHGTDDNIDGIPYEDIVESARQFIENLGGFEKLAEWGLI